MNLIFSKDTFDIDKINLEIKNFCNNQNIDKDKLLKIQLITEEYLSNIVFPNYKDEIKLSVTQEEKDTVLLFEYSDVDFMNKINENTVLSLKILQNKTKDIISNTTNNKTSVRFVI